MFRAIKKEVMTNGVDKSRTMAKKRRREIRERVIMEDQIMGSNL